jgi:hypothetical protein
MLIEDSDVAAVGEAARAEAVDGKGHISPGTQPISDPGEMPGNANTAVQYDNRRERSTAVGRTAELPLVGAFVEWWCSGQPSVASIC